jgi:S-formylglutathione hydrolase FrmB
MNNRNLDATVILPDSYSKSGNKYPVIYLLHGYSQNFSVWPRIADIGEYSDSLQIIFVCPEGRFNSWYIDSPQIPDSRFETYIAIEVPAFIDSAFRTINKRNGRAIAGSSMGGHGALSIMLRHQSRFVAAASISGIMDLREFPQMWDIAAVLGSFRNNPDRWKEFSVVGLIEKRDVSGGIFITCGLSDFALNANRKTHEILSNRNVPHAYREEAGGHTSEFAKREFPYAIYFLAEKLAKPAPAVKN